MRNGAGPGRTRDDHLDVAAQLFALVARARQVAELAELIGADALSADDRATSASRKRSRRVPGPGPRREPRSTRRWIAPGPSPRGFLAASSAWSPHRRWRRTTAMALRIPPGRAGRQWLAARIATAEHARDLLEQKRAVLIGAEREPRRSPQRRAPSGARAPQRRSAGSNGRLCSTASAPGALRGHTRARGGAHHLADDDGRRRACRRLRRLPPPPDVALLPGGSALTSACGPSPCAGRGAASRCRAGCTRAARRRAPRDGAASAGDRVPLAAAARAGTRRPRADARRARPRGGRGIRWASHRRQLARHLAGVGLVFVRGSVVAAPRRAVHPRPVEEGALGGGGVLGAAAPRLERRCLQCASVDELPGCGPMAFIALR